MHQQYGHFFQHWNVQLMCSAHLREVKTYEVKASHTLMSLILKIKVTMSSQFYWLECAAHSNRQNSGDRRYGL